VYNNLWLIEPWMFTMTSTESWNFETQLFKVLRYMFILLAEPRNTSKIKKYSRGVRLINIFSHACLVGLRISGTVPWIALNLMIWWLMICTCSSDF
jgi:hypothetical protein